MHLMIISKRECSITNQTHIEHSRSTNAFVEIKLFVNEPSFNKCWLSSTSVCKALDSTNVSRRSTNVTSFFFQIFVENNTLERIEKHHFFTRTQSFFLISVTAWQTFFELKKHFRHFPCQIIWHANKCVCWEARHTCSSRFSNPPCSTTRAKQ